MLNPFPELLTYGLLSPFILRVTLGLILANLGYLKLTKEKASWEVIFKMMGLSKQKELATIIVGIVEIVGGLALIAGFYTQIAALVFVFLNGIEMYIEYKNAMLIKRNIVFYILIFVIALSLLFSGAGFMAFDLPL
jgi:uncharacterized membrane protein YphA (DoxX/SURF4 family)